jgi:hypothetical protein
MWKAIINWINSKAYRCEHKWKLLKEVNVFWSAGDKLPHTTKMTYMCSKCGNHKTIKI